MSSLIEFNEDYAVQFCSTPNNHLKYVAEQKSQTSEEVLCWLKLSNQFILVLDKIGDDKERMNTLNSAIPASAFNISTSNVRIAKLLSRKCYLVRTKFVSLNKKGSKEARNAFKNGFISFSIKVGDIITAEEWSLELKKAQADVDCLSKELESWKSKYHDLEKEKETLFTEMKAEIEDKTMESVKNIKGIEDENNQLKNYVNKLEKQELGFKELPMSELKTRQAKNRKLRELKTRAQKALYFAELYGLQISSLGLNKGIQDGILYTLKFSQGTTPPDTNQTPTKNANMHCSTETSCTESASSTPSGSPVSTSDSATRLSSKANTTPPPISSSSTQESKISSILQFA